MIIIIKIILYHILYHILYNTIYIVIDNDNNKKYIYNLTGLTITIVWYTKKSTY